MPKRIRKPKPKHEPILTPQQVAFLSYYTDIKSETFGNGYKSALMAKYGEEYAQNITAQLPKWLSDNISDAEMLTKAERNIKKFLDSDKDLKVQADITKFVTSRLNKAKWSERTELTGKNGKDLLPKPIMELEDKVE